MVLNLMKQLINVIMAEFILSAQKSFLVPSILVKAVLTFGMVQAGSSDSVIPDSAFCKGQYVPLIQNCKLMFKRKWISYYKVHCDITYDMEYIRGYLPVHNHEEAYETVKQAANDLHLRFNKSRIDDDW